MANNIINFKKGSAKEYKDLATKDDDNIYVTTDDGKIYLGETPLGGDSGVEITQEEYDKLTNEQKMNGTVYFIKDGEGSDITISSVKGLQAELDKIPKTTISADDIEAGVTPLATGAFYYVYE